MGKTCAIVLVWALAGCGGDDRTGSGGSGSGHDSGVGSPGDAGGGGGGTDAGGGADAGGGGGADAGGGGGTDAGGGAGTDAGTRESAAGADPRAGFVGCGDTSCEWPEVCCVGLSGQMCTGASGCSGGFSAAGHCDGPEDCGSSESCCVHFEMFGSDPNGAFCRPGGCPSGDDELCHDDSDCTGGATCVACVPPTGGVIDVVYGICSSGGTCPSPYTMAP